MALDDEAKQKELERQRLIEEIRKRAEEAELTRIEEEEGKAGLASKTPSPSAQSAPPPPPHPVAAAPSVPPVAPSAPSVSNQRVIELQEKLSIALDRGLADKAAALFTELSSLIPNDPELRPYQLRLAVLQGNKQESKVRKKGSEKIDPAKARAEAEAKRKKIAELIERVNSLYQGEKYDLAVNVLGEIEQLDPENQEARSLGEQVEKARRLAAELKEEEEKRKAALAASQPKTAPTAKVPENREPGDVWGAPTAVVETQTVFEDPEEQAAKAPKKEPVIFRLAEQATRIRIPVKPLVTALVVLIAAVSAYYVFDAITTKVFPPKHSILVFPPTSDLTDGSGDFLLEGLAEDIIQDLAVLPDVRLIAPATALTFMDPRTHTVQTAADLSCMYFLRWSVSRRNEAVAIQMSLFDTLSSSPVWDISQEISIRELPQFRLEMAKEIAVRIGAQLSAEQERAFGVLSTMNPEAYDMYLRARFVVRHSPEQPVEEAIRLFDVARSLDSTFADVHSARGWAHILSYELGGAKGHLTEALRSVQRALSINPASGEAMRVWAMVHHYNAEPLKALERMREAAALAPADAETQRLLAMLFLVNGRMDDAVRAAEQGVALNPRSELPHTMLGQVRQYRGQYVSERQEDRLKDFRAALQSFETGSRFASDRPAYLSDHNADILVYLEQHDRALELLTDRIAGERGSYQELYRFARVLQSGGKPATQWQGYLVRAKRELEQRLARQPVDAVGQSFLALIHTRLGESKEASAAIANAISTASENVYVLYNVARAYSIRREKGEALAYLGKAIERRYDLASILDMDFYNLRGEAEFRTTITR